MRDGTSTTRSLAWVALSLFVAGLLMPFLLFAALRLAKLPPTAAAQIAFGFGTASELLAFVLGLVGWRHTPGKVAFLGAGFVVGLTAFAVVSFVFRSSH
jgi:hypothetical protein